MPIRKKDAAWLTAAAIVTAALAVGINAQPDEIGNNTTLAVEIAIGLSVAIIVYYFSSKSDAEIKGILKRITAIAEEQVRLKERQTAKARRELVENLNNISKDTKRGLHYADLQTRRVLPNVDKDAIEVVCNSVRAHIDGLDRLNTPDYDIFSTSDKRRLHTLKTWSDKPVGEVDGVKFCITIRRIVDGWLKSMDRAKGADLEAEQAGTELAISAEVDRTVYPIGGTVYVRTRVIPVIAGENILFQAFDQNGNRLWGEEIDPQGTGLNPDLSARGIFEASFQILGPEWKTECRYRITATFRGQTADVEFFVNHHVPVIESDKPAYTLPSAMIITVVDPDSNKDNRSVESIGDRPDSRIVIETDLGRIDGYRLVESGPGTGIFQGVVEIEAVELQKEQGEAAHAASGAGSDDGRIACKKGEEIRIRYTNGEDTAEMAARAENSDAVVEMDQKIYTCTDKVYIAVAAPRFSEPSRADAVVDKKEISVSVLSSIGKLDNYVLSETGPDTGIFTGEVCLTGFEGMEDYVRASGGGRRFGTTGGDGPADGTLACQAKDAVEVVFDAGGSRSWGAAAVGWNVGVVALDRPAYRVGETAVVTVVDPDMNLDPDAEDSFKVRLWSDSDRDGIWMTVRETGTATGIFRGSVLFDSQGSSEAEARLQVAVGEAVHVEYKDTTVPESSGAHDTQRIGSSSRITADGTVTPPLERARLEMDVRNEKTGTEVIKSGDAVAVTVKATALERPASFVALVQIESMNGAGPDPMQHLMDSETGPTEHTFAWRPPEPGVFTVTAFLWKSIDHPTPLCEPVTKEVNVV